MYKITFSEIAFLGIGQYSLLNKFIYDVDLVTTLLYGRKSPTTSGLWSSITESINYIGFYAGLTLTIPSTISLYLVPFLFAHLHIDLRDHPLFN